MTTSTMAHPEELERLRAEIARIGAERDAALAARDQAVTARDRALAAQDKLKKRVDQLQVKVDALLGQLYGQKSERHREVEAQRELFEAEKKEQAESELPAPPFVGEAPDGEVPQPDPVPGKRGGKGKEKKKGRQDHGWGNLPESLPRVEELHLPSPDELSCDRCQRERVSIGSPEITERLDFAPESLFVVRHVRHRFRCPCCQDGTVVAPLPRPPIGTSKGRPEAGLLAYVVASKYSDHLPLNRLESILAREGFALSQSTMCDWLGLTARLLDPIAKQVLQQVVTRPVVGMDETGVRVLYREEDGLKGEKRKARIWVYRGLPGEVYFAISESKTKDDEEGPLTVLAQYKGYVQADAASNFDEVYKSGERIEVGCNAHARRRFFEARKAFPREASFALGTYRKMWEIEARIRGMTPEERRAVRQAETKPLLDAFDGWVDELAASPALAPGTLLAKAIGYSKNHRVALRRFLDDGRLEVDNNAVERALRLVALGRKNWLFAGSKQAALDAAVFYTLIASCRELGIEPWAYLRDVIKRRAEEPSTDPALLSPRAWQTARVAAESPVRAETTSPTV